MNNKQKLTEILLEKSVRFGDFKLFSGKKTDFYVDGKMTTLNPFSGSEENIDYVKKLLGLYDNEVQDKFEKEYKGGLRKHNIEKYGGEKGDSRIFRLNQQLKKFKDGEEISSIAKQELVKLGLIQ